jgi:GTP1/Obg family GTP-binding protein
MACVRTKIDDNQKVHITMFAIIVTGVPNLAKPTLFCACYKKMCTLCVSSVFACLCLESN